MFPIMRALNQNTKGKKKHNSSTEDINKENITPSLTMKKSQTIYIILPLFEPLRGPRFQNSQEFRIPKYNNLFQGNLGITNCFNLGKAWEKGMATTKVRRKQTFNES